MAPERLAHLEGKTLSGYRLIKWLGAGATAATFKAQGATGPEVAVKILDPSSLYAGGDMEEVRLQRQLDLAGHACPNLVTILGGGKGTVDETIYQYLIMEFVDGPELSEAAKNGRLNDATIRKLLLGLWNACEFLRSREMEHRDIKPQNIKIRSATGEAVLLDTGVLWRDDGDNGTVEETGHKQFLGTTRYSPWEYLRRLDLPSPEGRKAITAYQIGAVLFEMIMGEEPFHSIQTPRSLLDDAIRDKKLVIQRADVGLDLIALANGLLAKAPHERLVGGRYEQIPNVCKASPALRPHPSDFEKRIGAIKGHHAREYEETIQPAKSRALELTQLRASTFEGSRQVVLKVLNEIQRAIQPSAAIWGSQTEFGIVLTEDLKEGILNTYFTWVQLEMPPGSTELVKALAISVWTNIQMKTNPRGSLVPGQRAQLDPTKLMAKKGIGRGQWAVVFDDVYSADLLQQLLEQWMQQRLLQYLEVTGPLVEAHRKETAENIEREATGAAKLPRKPYVPFFQIITPP